MSVLERHIEAEVVRWAALNNFLTPKVKFVEVGWPDRLFISPKGRHIYIEFKKPGEKPRPIQHHRIKGLERRNVIAVWTDSYDYAVGLLQSILDTEAISNEGTETARFPSSGGTSAGPRSGQDQHSARGHQNPEVERTSFQNPYRSAPTGDADGVASGGEEVVRVPTPLRIDRSRGPEGGGTEDGG